LNKVLEGHADVEVEPTARELAAAARKNGM
jgi:hypothetical protein